MEAKHTTGPWAPFILDKPLEEIPAYVEKCIRASGGSDFYFVSGRDERGDLDIAHVGNGPRGLANASLIAAAPDLLAIAMEARALLERGPDTTEAEREDVWRGLSEAIAKATQ